MSLLEKSQKSLEAAKILIDQECPNQSVHHSYYAVFQKIKFHALNDFVKPISPEQLKKLGKKEKGVHVALNNLFFKEMLARRISAEKAIWFKRQLERLKLDRATADYEAKHFAKKEANKKRNKSLELLSFTKDVYQ